jgi:hypothetical protein
MLNQDFENIRPYSDAETASVAKSLSNSKDWIALLTPLIGADNAEEISEAMPLIQSVQEFQDELTFPFLEALIEGTTDRVSVSFDAETVELALTETTLHITNHKDIVLDPSLVNVARMGNGYSSTEIGIGDNLLSQKWIEDLVRINRCFVVPRGGSARERWASSLLVSDYIRSAIARGQSVWLAQKEGRAKNGKDSTSSALIRMLISEGGKKTWEDLNVRPVSLSYEWDPCDSFKVRELLMIEINGSYEKDVGEDELSMAIGITGHKGRVHLHFCDTIQWDEEEGIRTERVLADIVDKAIFKGYEVFPNQILAARYLKINLPEKLRLPVDSNDEKLFASRLNDVVDFIGTGLCSQEEIERKWCEITVQPLLAKYQITV